MSPTATSRSKSIISGVTSMIRRRKLVFGMRRCRPPVLALLRDWKNTSKRTKPTDFIFATRNGKPESGNNILRRHVYPACDAAKIPRANWLTFRRTFSNWSHQQGIPAKDIAEIMGHSEVEMQFIYTAGVDEDKRRAAERLGNQL